MDRMSGIVSHHRRMQIEPKILLVATALLLVLSSSCSNAFSPTVTPTRTRASVLRLSVASFRKRVYSSSSSSSSLFASLASSAATADDFDSSEDSGDDLTTTEQVDQVFNTVDIDGSGAIDLEEFNRHLSSAGYSSDAIQESFAEMDSDSNGEISRAEFRQALLNADTNKEDDGNCPKGYFLNSVKQTCEPLGPIGRISQTVETLAPFRRTYRRISNLFGVDTKNISKLGVSFVLSYSVISNLNGAASFSLAWYISCKQVSCVYESDLPRDCGAYCLCSSIYLSSSLTYIIYT